MTWPEALECVRHLRTLPNEADFGVPLVFVPETIPGPVTGKPMFNGLKQVMVALPELDPRLAWHDLRVFKAFVDDLQAKAKGEV